MVQNGNGWTLDDNGMLTVSSETAWKNKNWEKANVRKATVQDGVTQIKESAFTKCPFLTDITVCADNPTYSSENGVLFNKDKTELVRYPEGKEGSTYTVPSSVTVIGDEAFVKCKRLTCINIPSSVKSIGDLTFCDCPSLTDITVSADNPNYSSENGILFNKDKTKLLHYPAEKKESTYTLPSSVTCIEKYVFSSCHSLTEITVPADNPCYTSEDGVLFNKDKTKLLRYPAGKEGSTYTVPDSVTCIGTEAFSRCQALTDITLPSSLTDIESMAFINCKALMAVNLPNSVKTVDILAFTGCSSLTDITVPSSVTKIWGDTFLGCSSLTEITVSTDNPDYASEDGVLFSKDKTKLLRYPEGKKDGTYTVPDSVTDIEEEAFLQCQFLTCVTLPSSVKTVGSWAFCKCQSLQSVTLPQNCQVGNNAFAHCTAEIIRR